MSLVDASSFSPGFPKAFQHEVLREHLVTTLEKMLLGGLQVVLLEGEEGLGATTLLAQFSRTGIERTMSCFISPASKLTYDPGFLRTSLATQMAWVLDKKEPTNGLVSESSYRDLVIRLQRRAQRTSPYFFVIDGISEIPNEDESIRELILKELLPIGLPELKFVISTQHVPIQTYFRQALLVKTFPLSPFSPPEVSEYLQDLQLSEEDMVKCRRLTKGIPGNLASVRRLVDSGRSIAQIVEAEPEQLPDFLQIEWDRFGAKPLVRDVLAVLTFGRRQFTQLELAGVLGQTVENIEGSIEACGFVETDQRTSEISFVTEAHRKFSAKKLEDVKQTTINRLIDNLVREGSSQAKTSLLPRYLEQAERYDDLLDFISEDHLANVVTQTSSITALQRDVSLALATASRLRTSTRLFRFALLRSAVAELVSSDPWLSEMEALVALGNYGEAISIANGARTKESRLRLLTAYARLVNEIGVPIDEPLRGQIIQLVEEVDIASLGAAAVDIAGDLIVVAPNTATKVIEECGGDSQHPEALDHAFLKLAIKAAKIDSGVEEMPSGIEKVQEKIKDESLRKLASGLSAMIGKGGAQETIRKVEQMETPYRSFALREWLKGNREHPDALAIVEYALDQMVRDTASTTTLRDLREVAIPLPYGVSLEKVRHLIKRIDSQKVTVQNLGSAEENIRLEMLLARAEASYNVGAAVHRIEAAFETVQSTKELAIRADCLAWILSSVTEMDPKVSYASLEEIREKAKVELSHLINLLLMDTAEQELVVRGPIRALSRVAYELATDIAMRLNTEERRNRAYAQIVRSINDTRRLTGRLGQVSDALKHVGDRDLAHRVFIESLGVIYDLPESALPEAEVIPFLREAFHISDAYWRTQGLQWALKIIIKRWPDRNSLALEFASQITVSVDAIDSTWLQAEVYFESAAVVARTMRPLALDLVGRANECKKRQVIVGQDLSNLYAYTLRLATRALSGATTKKVFSKDHIDRLEFLIDQIPSMAQRAKIWGDLAMRCWGYGAQELVHELVTKHVWPAVNAIAPEDQQALEYALSAVVPCLYFNSPGATDAVLSRLSRVDRDLAYKSICLFLITRLPPYEPRRRDVAERQRLDFHQARECCEVLAKIKTDSTFFYALDSIVDTLCDKAARDWLNRQQKAEIAARLEELANNALPDKNNITHDGFLVSSLALIYKLRQASPNEWDLLVKRALSIPNMSDRAIVLGYVAMAIPSKSSMKRHELLTQAEKVVEQIPAEFDRARRFQWLADLTVREEPAVARRFVRAAFQSSLAFRDEDRASDLQKEAIEVAHRIDPDYANELARSIDDDPAKIRARVDAKEQIDLLKTKKVLAEAGNIDLQNAKLRRQIPEAAWSSLAALNVGRNVPQRLEQFTDYLLFGASVDLRISYAVFAWIIENANRRYAATEQARDVCIALSEAALMTASLLQRIMAQVNRDAGYLNKTSTSTGTDAIVIREGEQEKARRIISDWVRSKASDVIRICDPYFSVDSLWILKIIKTEKPGCRVSIVMGRKHLKGKPNLVEDEFRRAWHTIADFDPPETDVVVAGVGEDGKAPIHERWILSHGTGLRIGTSLADIGSGRISEISTLSDEDVIAREQEIGQYATFEKRIQNGERIRYNSFSLP